MKKLLIIALLFLGCDYAPSEHEHEHTHEHSHDEYVHTHEHEHDTTHEHDTAHWSCILHYIYLCSTTPDDSIYVIDTLYAMHQSNLNDAISQCNSVTNHSCPQLTEGEIPYMVHDSTWCECEAGILY